MCAFWLIETQGICLDVSCDFHHRYVMTSEHTQDATLEFFSNNNYFGLDPKNILFFEQNTLPCMSLDGKIILETKSPLTRAPGREAIVCRYLSSGSLTTLL